MKTIKLLAFATSTALAMALAGCTGDDTTAATPDSGSTTDGSGGHDTGTGTDTGTGNDTGPGTDASDGGGDAPTPPVVGQIDRMGRPAINTALNYGDEPTKDSYNHENTIQDWSVNHKYDTNFNANLQTFDKLGGDAVDWPVSDAGVHPLRDPLKLDVLFLDTGKTCTAANAYCETGYLEIEAQLLLGGATHVTCGGRTLPEDVIDKTLTLLITKGRAVISDGVNNATKAPTRTWPYLATPN